VDANAKSLEDLSDLQLDRLNQVASLRARGKTMAEIAGAMKLPAAEVRVLHRLARLQRLAKAQVSCEEIVAEDLRKLEEIEREAWIQWERSAKTAKELTKESVDKESNFGPSMTIKNKKVTKARLAEARYLELCMKAMNKRHELMGIGKNSATDLPDIALVEVVIDDRSQLPEVMDYGRFIEMKNSTVDGKVIYVPPEKSEG
jgi:hypothetical protein